MEATYFSETSVDFQLITWFYTPEDRTFSSYVIATPLDIQVHTEDRSL
jgi:hypothetical protein